mmetsp:Transcript_380/g.856  ORF Transcript_380/g.856 Transcript_380/m.856 type:complete len:465 (-) Transcript_380:68-1462(-)
MNNPFEDVFEESFRVNKLRKMHADLVHPAGAHRWYWVAEELVEKTWPAELEALIKCWESLMREESALAEASGRSKLIAKASYLLQHDLVKMYEGDQEYEEADTFRAAYLKRFDNAPAENDVEVTWGRAKAAMSEFHALWKAWLPASLKSMDLYKASTTELDKLDEAASRLLKQRKIEHEVHFFALAHTNLAGELSGPVNRVKAALQTEGEWLRRRYREGPLEAFSKLTQVWLSYGAFTLPRQIKRLQSMITKYKSWFEPGVLESDNIQKLLRAVGVPSRELTTTEKNVASTYQQLAHAMQQIDASFFQPLSETEVADQVTKHFRRIRYRILRPSCPTCHAMTVIRTDVVSIVMACNNQNCGHCFCIWCFKDVGLSMRRGMEHARACTFKPEHVQQTGVHMTVVEKVWIRLRRQRLRSYMANEVRDEDIRMALKMRLKPFLTPKVIGPSFRYTRNEVKTVAAKGF